MCWVALDRAIALADLLGAKDRVEAWTTAREEIRAAILERGWSERALTPRRSAATTWTPAA
jgi:GH15 family glucan-1,4-alpha-glucosidase